MTKHTQGPWRITDLTCNNRSEKFVAHLKGCAVVAVKSKETDIEEDKANARLIAAAPELLEQLEKAVLFLHNLNRFDLDLMKAVIAKAKGGNRD